MRLSTCCLHIVTFDLRVHLVSENNSLKSDFLELCMIAVLVLKKLLCEIFSHSPTSFISMNVTFFASSDSSGSYYLTKNHSPQN